eukprot:PhM_4_TR3711/c0_g1_i1/m.12240
MTSTTEGPNVTTDEINLELDRDEPVVNFFLQGAILGPTGAYHLSTILPFKSNIRVLELRSSRIGMTGAPHIARAIARHPTLEYVGLGHNHLSSHGAADIIRVLMHEESAITGLDLQWNDVADSAAKVLGDALAVNRTLVSINLDRNRIRSEGTLAICDGLAKNTTLQNLSMAWNRVRVGAEHFGSALRQNKSLLTLNFASNEVNAETAQAFATKLSTPNTTLLTLDVSQNNLGELGGHAVLSILGPDGMLPKLREVNLSGCHIPPSDRVQTALENVVRANTQLFHFAIGSNPLKDRCTARYLAACENNVALRVLDLSGLGATHEAVGASLSTIVGTCSSMHTLTLDGVNLGFTGAAVLGQALTQTSALTTLNASGCVLGSGGARNLAQGLGQQNRLIHLALADNDMVTDGTTEICLALLSYHGLESLDIRNNGAGGAVAPLLKRLILTHPRLPQISIMGNDCMGSGPNVPVYTRHNAVMFDIVPPVPPLCDEQHDDVDAAGMAREDLSAYGDGGMTEDADGDTTVFSRRLKGTATNNTRGVGTSSTKSVAPADDGGIVQPDPAAAAAAVPYGRKWNNFQRGTPVREILRPDEARTQRNAALFFATPATTLRSPGTFTMQHNLDPREMFAHSNEQLLEVFARLDKDGSGYLDVKEVKGLVKTMEHYGVEYSDHEIDRMLQRYHVFKDGKLSFDEFQVVMLQLAKR